MRFLRQVSGAMASLLALAAGALAGTAGYQAHHRPAQELARLVGFALRSEACHFTADEKTNTVIVAGPEAAVAQAVARLGELDRAPLGLSVLLVVELEGKPAWQGRMSALSGVTARLGTEALRGSVTATQVAGAFDVRVQLDVKTGSSTTRVATAVRTSAGRAELARLPVEGKTLVVSAQVEAAASR